MKPAIKLGLLVAALSFPMCSPSFAGLSDCQEAINGIKTARADIRTGLQSYATCVSGSDGTDDCSTEMETLKSAHDDFETAVGSYQSDCQ